MEPIQYFTGLVLLMCAMHGIAMVAQTVRGFMPERTSEKRSEQPRSDWYTFFCCSALTGQQPEKRVSQSPARDAQQKRPAAQQRPRLYC